MSKKNKIGWKDKVLNRFAKTAAEEDKMYVTALIELQIVLKMKYGDAIKDQSTKISLPKLEELIEALKDDKIANALNMDFI